MTSHFVRAAQAAEVESAGCRVVQTNGHTMEGQMG